MEDREMLKKIEESAQDLKVPKALEPGQVKKLLDTEKLKTEKTDKKGVPIRKYAGLKTIAAAACLCLCFGVGSIVYQSHMGQENRMAADDAAQGHMAAGDAAQEHMAAGDAAQGHMAAGDAGAADDTETAGEAPVRKLGKMYTLAADYKEVYRVLKKDTERKMAQKEVLKNERFAENTYGIDSEGAVGGSFEAEDIASAMTHSARQTEDSAVSAAPDASAAEGSGDFSTTNLQVEGVDESDCVKTDGRFIYVVQDAQVQVLDVRGQIPKKAGTIRPDMDEDTDRICEMYVADGMLTLIVQTERTSLQQGGGKEADDRVYASPVEDGRKHEGLSGALGAETEPGETGSGAETEPGETGLGAETEPGETGSGAEVDCLVGEVAEEDVQRIITKETTKVITYDLTDPEKPVLKDTATQDGQFQTARKIANHLYLFTGQSLGITGEMKREEMLQEDRLDAWLPCVNDKAVPADCIYLSETGSQGLLMSSIDLAGHNKVLDMKLLVNQYAQLYVSSSSVYLYYNDYTDDTAKTRIARFALEADGSIRAKAARAVKGSIEDTFALHEREGYLQVLTSVTDANPWENRVYVLDENMEVAGKLTGLAKGEKIYAARFAGAVGYFVTYRNTDPLFTVDFSNPREPKVIGELKVSGFSEYLHFWSDDRLLGIGYETDPESGMTVGIKLSMFDISNPAKVKEEAKLVIEGVIECDAMYDYKTVLVDPKKNLIAFTTKKYDEKFEEHYRVFSYGDGAFVHRIGQTLYAKKEAFPDSRWRSVYVGDMLYLVNERKILTFAMAEGFKKVANLKYE